MNLTDHDNLAQGAMPEPSIAQKLEYYRLYKEVEADVMWLKQQQLAPTSTYQPKSRLIHAEVVRRMGLNEVKEM